VEEITVSAVCRPIDGVDRIWTLSEVALTGEIAAHLLVDGSWGELGIQAVITKAMDLRFVHTFSPKFVVRFSIRCTFHKLIGPEKMHGRTWQENLFVMFRRESRTTEGGRNIRGSNDLQCPFASTTTWPTLRLVLARINCFLDVTIPEREFLISSIETVWRQSNGVKEHS